jgi:antitoxin MazE
MQKIDAKTAGNYNVIMTERASITTDIVDIGNSKGLRIPKFIRAELGLEGSVTLTVTDGALVVRSKRQPRADWQERFATAKSPESEPLLMPDDLGTDFDSGWTW